MTSEQQKPIADNDEVALYLLGQAPAPVTSGIERAIEGDLEFASKVEMLRALLFADSELNVRPQADASFFRRLESGSEAQSPEADFERIVKELVEGSEQAAHELTTKHASRLLEEVRQHLGPRIRARFDSTDFLNDVPALFSADSKDRPRFTSRDDLMAFLKAMAKHKVIDAIRRQGTVRLRDIKADPLGDNSKDFEEAPLADKQAVPLQIVMNEVEWQEFLRKQPPVYRRLFTLLREGKSGV